MPCRDYYDDHPEQYFKDVTEPALKKQISFAESALCQVLRALEYVDTQVETVSPKKGDWYDWIDFRAAGITKKELVAWHKQHKALDEKHRTEEAAKYEQEVIRKNALSKLTLAERKALGVD